MNSPLLRRLLLVLFVVLMALFFIALFLPAVDPLPTQTANCQPAPISTQVRELLGASRTACSRERFMWPPNAGDEYTQEVFFNNFGLNAPIYTLAKPDNVFRIVLVGDSFPQGVQVAMEAGFPYLLGQTLSADGRRVEVINLSIDAIGTDRELLLYALLGWQFQPDLVLLSVYPSNDIQDNEIDLEARRYGYRLDRPFFTLNDYELLMHNSSTFFDPAAYDSAPYQWLARMGAEQLPPPPDNPPEHPTVTGENPYMLEYPVELGLYLPEDAHWANAWNITQALLLQFRDLVESSGIPFAVVMIPDRRAVHDEDWLATQTQFEAITPDIWRADPLAPTNRLETFLSDNGIPVFNLTTALRAWAVEHPGERLYYRGDGHFNADGHTAAAGAIGVWLKEEQLIL